MDIAWTGTGRAPRAWLVLSKNDRTTGRGEHAYDDDVSASYVSDSNVPNSRNIEPGDRIVVWDQRRLLGASVVERVDAAEAKKRLPQCPTCRRSKDMSRPRKTSPRFRCGGCGSEFDEPAYVTAGVTEFRTSHDEGWVDLTGQLDGPTLRSLCESPSSQLSIRALDWGRFSDALGGSDTGRRGVRMFNAVSGQMSGGFSERVTRVRVGQASFRAELLTRFGSCCAFSGDQPREVLEAAHLYSYAQVGVHEDEGGLLLRRDLHALFDLGKLAVRRDSRIAVHSSIRDYPLYQECEGQPLQVSVTGRQREWLAQHRRLWSVDD